uniref:Solute carrier family 19 member 1 n=1 Tax=Echeneis naucrates TaxID=173247 RepID=A0A665W7Y3_ECHNA
MLASGHNDADNGDVEMAVSASEALASSKGPPVEATEARKWKWAVIFLCFYGFMSSMKPGESFMTPYLLSPEKNFTKQQLLWLRPNLRLWSIWWIFNSTGYYLVLFYVHILWNTVYPDTVNNGGVEAASTLLSAMMSFLAGYVKVRWNIFSELLIGVITALQGGLLLIMGTTNNIWVCYLTYVLFRGFYQFLVPIATFQIASSLTRELCALMFGINTFLGTILKSIFNLIFSDKRGLALDVHSQFRVYFIYFALLTAAYLIGAAVVIIRHYRNQSTDEAPPTELSPVEVNSEAEPLANGKSAKA